MLHKKTLVLSIIFSLLSIVILPLQSMGQTSNALMQDTIAVNNTSRIENPPLNSLLKSETEDSKIKASLEQIKRDEYKVTSKTYKRKMSSKKKTAIWIGVGAAIAAVVIIIIATRDSDDGFVCIPEDVACTSRN